MAYQNGTVTGHLNLLKEIKAFATSSGMGSQAWTVLRWAGIEDYLYSSQLGGNEAFNAFNGWGPAWQTALGAATPSYLGCQFVAPVDHLNFAFLRIFFPVDKVLLSFAVDPVEPGPQTEP